MQIIFFFNSNTELQNHGNLIVPRQNLENQETPIIQNPELRKQLKFKYSTITRQLRNS